MECELYTYVQIPPLSYEIFRYTPLKTEINHAEVASGGFDGLYRDAFTVFES